MLPVNLFGGVVIEAPAIEGYPSFVEVSRYWTQIQIEAQRIDRALANIDGMLRKLRRGAHHHTVRIEELEQAEEWFAVKREALTFVLRRWCDGNVFLDEYFTDGAGI